MTILSWVAGFQLRTGWQFLSAAESAQLSESIRMPEGLCLRAIARHIGNGEVACLDTRESNPDRARLIILRNENKRRATIEEEHASLAAWIRALGITSQGVTGPHDSV